MKRALCSAALALSFSGVAGAADLAVEAPVPGFSWTGIYLGIGGGTGWGNKEYSWNQDATVAAIAAQMQNPRPLPHLGVTQGSHTAAQLQAFNPSYLINTVAELPDLLKI